MLSRVSQFLTLFVLVTMSTLQAARAEDKDSVEGIFTGNGKPSRLAFISASRGDVFSGKPTFQIIMTEQDHRTAKRPAMKAGFGDFGSALIITVHPDGKIVGCEVAHSAHTRKPFSSIGKIEMKNFSIKDGVMKGTLETPGEVETFKQKWSVKLGFGVKIQ